MSESGRLSATVSLHSSVGTTSAEELAEKYQKLFLEFSRIKAQHSVLKKAVIKEQATNIALQDECKTKEQELRSSLQQLDLLNFHNERLTKRIQSLQDSGNSRLSSGWLLGSAKKELEKSKATLEARTVDLTQKIEENEKLHKELYEVNSLYTQHVNVLQSDISELQKKNEELQLELTRSHLASEEALSTMRVEKREVEVKLDKIKDELRLTNALMEKNEQKLKEDDDVLRSELNALRQTLLINLGLADDTSKQFNGLSENFDSESNEIIESYRQLQISTKNYLDAFKENSDSSYDLSVDVKNASQAWRKNLQTLANKFTSAQNQISKLTAEKKSLEENTKNANALVEEISRLKKELNNQVVTPPNGLSEGNSQNLNKSSTTDLLKLESKNNSLQEEKVSVNNEIKVENIIDPNENDDDETDQFIYPVYEESTESTQTSVEKSTQVEVDQFGNGTASFFELERGMSVRKDDDAKERENLIKKHYEYQITQYKEQLQLSEGNALRFHEGSKILKSKLMETEAKKSRCDDEIKKLQEEIKTLRKDLETEKENCAEEKKNHKKSVDTMTEWIQTLSNEKKELEKSAEPGSSR